MTNIFLISLCVVTNFGYAVFKPSTNNLYTLEPSGFNSTNIQTIATIGYMDGTNPVKLLSWPVEGKKL